MKQKTRPETKDSACDLARFMKPFRDIARHGPYPEHPGLSYSPGPVQICADIKTSPFIAKNYAGYRMLFHPKSDSDKFAKIVDRGIEKTPSEANIALFKRDLLESAKTDHEVKSFLDKHPLPN